MKRILRCVFGVFFSSLIGAAALPTRSQGDVSHPAEDRKAAIAATGAPDRQAAQTIPDFTQGGQRDQSHDWTLGPTGARGWIHTANGHSRDARQILITAVAQGSPANGVLAAGDVILGTGSGNFGGDARIEFAKAIAAAESGEEKGGRKIDPAPLV